MEDGNFKHSENMYNKSVTQVQRMTETQACMTLEVLKVIHQYL